MGVIPTRNARRRVTPCIHYMEAAAYTTFPNKTSGCFAAQVPVIPPLGVVRSARVPVMPWPRPRSAKFCLWHLASIPPDGGPLCFRQRCPAPTARKNSTVVVRCDRQASDALSLGGQVAAATARPAMPSLEDACFNSHWLYYKMNERQF